MKKYHKRKEYWESAFIVWWCKSLLGLPKYKYAWWNIRLKLIKEGEI